MDKLEPWSYGKSSGIFGNNSDNGCDNVMVDTVIDSHCDGILKADNVRWNPADDKYHLIETYKVKPNKLDEFKAWHEDMLKDMLNKCLLDSATVIKVQMIPQI